MALSRIRCSKDLSNIFSRFNDPVKKLRTEPHHTCLYSVIFGNIGNPARRHSGEDRVDFYDRFVAIDPNAKGLPTSAILARSMPTTIESRLKYSTNGKLTIRDSAKAECVGGNVRTTDAALTSSEKLKKAIKDYGGTVMVFHISISLISLGICYVTVSSGLDVGSFVKIISPGANERFENAMANSSTFLVAYAVHKLLAPVRISITLGATPFVVRYLRNIGILKMPKG